MDWNASRRRRRRAEAQLSRKNLVYFLDRTKAG